MLVSLLVSLLVVAVVGTGLTVLSQNGRGRAIRFSTLAALCRELDCQPGDLLGYDPGLDATRR